MGHACSNSEKSEELQLVWVGDCTMPSCDTWHFNVGVKIITLRKKIL